MSEQGNTPATRGSVTEMTHADLLAANAALAALMAEYDRLAARVAELEALAAKAADALHDAAWVMAGAKTVRAQTERIEWEIRVALDEQLDSLAAPDRSEREMLDQYMRSWQALKAERDRLAARVADLEAENEQLRANQRTGRIIHGDALAEPPDRSEQ
jgi:hypothetical protein